MLDEEMDNRIREAAGSHHPPYNDKAWEKMELLLDKHMPQKKEKRRWLPFLLLFLLLGTSALVAILKPWKTAEEKPVVSGMEKKGTARPAELNSNPAGENSTVQPSQPSGALHTDNKPSDPAAPITNQAQNTPKAVNETTLPASRLAEQITNPGTGNTGRGKNVNAGPIDATNANALKTGRGKPVPSKGSVNKGNEQGLMAGGNKKQRNSKGRLSSQVIQPGLTEDDNSNPAVVKRDQPAGQLKDLVGKAVPDVKTEPVNNKDAQVKTDPDKKSTDKKDLVAKAEDKKPEALNSTGKTADKKEKKKGGFGNNFALTATVGGDMSFINLNKPGKITLLYGAGLSYRFTKRFSVSTGFYVSDKIYSATPAQYNNTIYPYLTNIDADCKIYQIPVSIRYHFGEKRKHGWSGSAGLTSLLIKKEAYEYDYKNPAGVYYSYHRTINDQNKHYFSMLSLSAGYSYQVSKRISVTGEPFVNIPLKGIGFGKMKLNSAGVQVSVSVKPFVKRKS